MSQVNPTPPGYSAFGPDFTRVQQQRVASNSITNANIRTGISLSKLSGNTLTLGGASNTLGMIKLNNASSVEILQADNTGLKVYGTSGDVIKIYDATTTTTPYAQLGYNTGTSYTNLTSLSAGGTIILQNFAVGSLSGTANTSITLGDNGASINDITIHAANNVNVTTGGSFKVNGSVKTAIVPTSQGYNALYCIESASVWFVDFCVGKRIKSWKFWRPEYSYEVDKLFAETIEPPYFFLPTTQKGIFQVWGRRKGYASHRLETKTQGDFEQNNQFWQQPK